jgi:hypothetical protein
MPKGCVVTIGARLEVSKKAIPPSNEHTLVCLKSNKFQTFLMTSYNYLIGDLTLQGNQHKEHNSKGQKEIW